MFLLGTRSPRCVSFHLEPAPDYEGQYVGRLELQARLESALRHDRGTDYAKLPRMEFRHPFSM